MESSRRLIRRRQLDRQLTQSSSEGLRQIPQGGWIRAVREGLGMTFEAFGSRLGVSRQNAQQIETAEVSGSITLKRLRAAADALNCDVLVSLVPRQPLEEFVQEQALQAARKQILRTAHSMALESQALTEPQLEALIGRSAREMIERGDARIWIQK